MFAPELEPHEDASRELPQIIQRSQDRLFANVIKFLIDGQDTNAATMLLDSNLTLLIDYEYVATDPYSGDFGWVDGGYIIRIACPRDAFDLLCRLPEPVKAGDLYTVDWAFSSVLGTGSVFYYEVTYSMDPVDTTSDWRAHLQQLIPDSSAKFTSAGGLEKVTTIHGQPDETLIQVDNMLNKELEETGSGLRKVLDDDTETRIFLCHKSDNKEMVERYYNVLQVLGFNPWLDKYDMLAGVNKHRGILKGIGESCAIVFFLTEDFSDEGTIAKEIDNSMTRKEKLGDKFAIISLRFAKGALVPALLENEIWHDVEDELDGLSALIRALPIKLGPVRWKESVVQ